LSADRSKLLVVGRHFITLWDLRSESKLAELNASKLFTHVVYGADSAAAVDYRGGLNFIALAASRRRIQSASDALARGIDTSVAFSSDGRLLVSGGAEPRDGEHKYANVVRIWAAATGELLRSIDAHSDKITAVGFIPGRAMIYSASLDRT